MMTYVTKIIENEDGELLVEFPLEILDQMGWNEDSILEWIVEDDQVFLREYIDD